MRPESISAPPAGEPEALAKLTETFDSFNKMSNELAHAWEELRDRTARLDVALNDANLRLNEKVVELDELNSNLDAILDSVPSAAVVTDTQLRVTRVNRTAEAILGIDRQATIGHSARRIVAADRRPILSLCRSAAPDNDVSSRDIELPDGRQLVITSRVSRVVDAAGQHLGYVEILTDITETEALRSRLHRLDTLAALGEMAAAIAHELRTPLTAVEGYAGLLRRSLERGADTASQLSQVDKIARGAHEAASIIQRILTFANPGILTRETVQITDLIEDTVAGHPSIRRHIDTPSQVARVKGDRLLLRQALRNLTENALAFCTESQVTLSVSTVAGKITIQVEDEGPGIPQALRTKLFMPFVSERKGGIGLGLAIVHRIIDLHGGTIRVADNPAGGACFIIQLPELTTTRIDEAAS